MGRSKAPKSGSVHPNGQPAPAAPANTTGQVVPKTSPEASGAGNSAPPIAPLEEEKGFWSSAFSAVASLDVHDALDAVGMVPGLGIAADLTNAALYAYEKDYTNAAISLAAASPIGGQAATAAKHATKAAAKAKAKQEAAEAAEAAARKADAPPPSKPPKKDKDTEEPKEGEGKDGGYVGGKGKKTKGKMDCGEAGTYKELKKKTGDGKYDRDHVPSKEALKRRASALMDGDELTTKQKKAIEDFGDAIAIPRQAHRDISPTYGARNKSLASSDANDLAGAAKRDIEEMLGQLHNYDDEKGTFTKAYKKASSKILKMTNKDFDEKLLKILEESL